MLILTRRPGERLCIGENVRVTVLGTKGEQVRLGIDAPRDVPVHRHEVYERIKRGGAATSRVTERIRTTGPPSDRLAVWRVGSAILGLNRDRYPQWMIR